MDWKNIEQDVSALAPVIGGLVGGPAGAGIGSAISAVLGVANTPDAVSQALKTDPAAAVKLATLENSYKLAQIAAGTAIADAAVQQIQSVDQTMQVEDKTRVFTWRDLWGYVSGIAFGFVVGLVIYIVVSAIYLNQSALMTQIPSIVGAFSVLFGIAATVLGVQSSIEAHHSGMVDRLNAGEGK